VVCAFVSPFPCPIRHYSVWIECHTIIHEYNLLFPICIFTYRIVLIILYYIILSLSLPRCHSLSHIVRGLAPGESYVFRVRAENMHGSSEASLESTPVYILQTGNVYNNNNNILIRLTRYRSNVRSYIVNISVYGFSQFHEAWPM
jgi:hypothetical protein